MSSSNLVSVTYTDEATYGEKADATGAITAQTARFTSESLSGTPQTTESEEIRQDRMSGGQVATGLEVGGDLNFELAPGAFFDKFFAMGMMAAWAAATADVSSVSFTLDGGDPQRGTLSATGISAGLSVGDVVSVDEGGNTHLFTIITVTDADNLVVACKRDQANFTGGTSRRPEYLDIGAVIQSVTMGKAYKDVVNTPGSDEYSQTYTGTLVSGFNIAAAFGQIVTGAFNTMGNGYEQESPSREQVIAANGGTITPAGTEQQLNASLDVPVVTTDGVATEFCMENFNLTLDNGLTPQNCIGYQAPKKYELGTAAINVDVGVYLGKDSYERFMPAKLSQAPISICFGMLNEDGGYAFALPALQLSFPDPGAAGQNQPTMIEASGTAKVGANGESALRIYKIVTP